MAIDRTGINSLDAGAIKSPSGSSIKYEGDIVEPQMKMAEWQGDPGTDSREEVREAWKDYLKYRQQGGTKTWQQFMPIWIRTNLAQGGIARFYNGGRALGARRRARAYGGIMDLGGRRRYGIGSWFQEKIKDPIVNTVKKIWDSPVGKAAILGTAANLGTKAVTGESILERVGETGVGQAIGTGIQKAKDIFGISGPTDVVKTGDPTQQGDYDITGKKILETGATGGWTQGIKNILTGVGEAAAGKDGSALSGWGKIAGIGIPAIAAGLWKQPETDLPEGRQFGTPEALEATRLMAQLTTPMEAAKQGLHFVPELEARKYSPEQYAAAYGAAQGGRIGFAKGTSKTNFQTWLKNKGYKIQSLMQPEELAPLRAEFLREYGADKAQGGRIGYANAGNVEDYYEGRGTPKERAEEIGGSYTNWKDFMYHSGASLVDDLDYYKYEEGLSKEETIKMYEQEWEDSIESGAYEPHQTTSFGNTPIRSKDQIREIIEEGWDMVKAPIADTGIATVAQGGRIGAQEGGLMNLGGMEKDYREEGGFVPIGGQERADDVPARLSKNEFVFTADAVRAAGGGDIDAGAEVMENVMENLERGGQVSEESQGLEGARGMFATAQRLGGVI